MTSTNQMYAEGWTRWATYDKASEARKIAAQMKSDGHQSKVTSRENIGTGGKQYIVWYKDRSGQK